MKFTRLKTCVRNGFIKQMKDSEGAKSPGSGRIYSR
jgi:hypothetical protein